MKNASTIATLVAGVVIIIGAMEVIRFASGTTTDTASQVVPSTVHAEPTPPPLPVEHWTYREFSDPMTDAKTSIACTPSTNLAKLSEPYQDVNARLCMRRAPRSGLNVYVELDGPGQILCGIEECEVHVRFDKRPMVDLPGAPAADNSSNIIFIRREGKFLTELKHAKTAVVELVFYRDGQQDLEFDVSELRPSWGHSP